MGDSYPKKVQVRIGQVVYKREVPNPRRPGETILKNTVGARGEFIEVFEADYEKGKRLDFWGDPSKDVDQQPPESEPDLFDASEANVDEIANHIEENKLNVEETVALAGDDPETAENVRDAEEQVAADNDAEPRVGVLDGLDKITG